jgi:hypothetical protein
MRPDNQYLLLFTWQGGDDVVLKARLEPGILMARREVVTLCPRPKFPLKVLSLPPINPEEPKSAPI